MYTGLVTLLSHLFLHRTTLGKICLKLSIVCGLTWIADVLSWAHGIWSGGAYHYIWIVTDLINTLQGVFIFIVIGCQPQVKWNWYHNLFAIDEIIVHKSAYLNTHLLLYPLLSLLLCLSVSRSALSVLLLNQSVRMPIKLVTRLGW